MLKKNKINANLLFSVKFIINLCKCQYNYSIYSELLLKEDVVLTGISGQLLPEQAPPVQFPLEYSHLGQLSRGQLQSE